MHLYFSNSQQSTRLENLIREKISLIILSIYNSVIDTMKYII